MANILIAVDAVLCVLILLAAVDYLRAGYFMDRPVVCLAFYMVAIGAFGLLTWLYAGNVPSPWSVLLHFGIALYAASHYRDIFERDWCWDGDERHRPSHR